MLLLLFACGSPEAWREVARSPGRTEVVPIGSLHRGHLQSEDYSLAVLEALLQASRAEAIFVEVPPVRFERVVDAALSGTEDEWLESLPEVGVAIRFAKEHGIPVVPVSGWSAQARDDRRAYFRAHPTGPDTDAYRRAARYRELRNDREGDEPEWILGPLYARLSAWTERALMSGAGDALGAAHGSRLWPRHLRLIEAGLREHAGKRIVVLFDARDRFLVEGLIEHRGVARVDPRGVLAMTPYW